MKQALVIMIFGALVLSNCRPAPETPSALLDELLSGTATKLPIDSASATSAGTYFFHHDGVHFVSTMTAAQYWGPQVGALPYSGKDGNAHVFEGATSVGQPSLGEIDGWIQILPQATAASLTKKYRINAKISFAVLQTAATAGHASLSIACITRWPTPEIPIPGLLKAVDFDDNAAVDTWRSKEFRVLSEPLDLSRCISDVFLSFAAFQAKAVKLQDPEVQLLAVTGG